MSPLRLLHRPVEDVVVLAAVAAVAALRVVDVAETAVAALPARLPVGPAVVLAVPAAVVVAAETDVVEPVAALPAQRRKPDAAAKADRVELPAGAAVAVVAVPPQRRAIVSSPTAYTSSPA